VVPRFIGGYRYDVRRLTITVYEHKVRKAIERELLQPENRDNPWTVTDAFFASMFSDHTIRWLHKHGFLAWGDRGSAEAVIAAVNDLIERQR
jgi:hypothetical protein